MFEKDKEEKELATNRLLDILRAQESGEVPKPEDKPIPIPIYREDKSRPGEEPVSSPVLKKDLKPTKEPLGIKKEKVEGVPKFEEISIDITQHKDLMSKEKPSGEVEKELEPEEFDGSLFSTMKDGIRKGSFTKGLSSIFHMFNESKRKITIYRSENHLRLLSIEYNYGECKIQRYAEYKLPYRAADKEIDDMDELTAYVFTREQNLSGKKVKYGALYSSKTLTRTNIIQTPKLKTKELTNMVQWSSKKNLPFAAEQAIVDWEVTPAAGEPSKNYVIIGVSERDSIERDLSIFSDNNMNARLISTLPVLLWKLFIYNYPDRKDGCYVLVHIGDTTTTISVVVKQTLLFTREIAIGAEDFYKAIIQRIVDKEKAIQIDHDLAEIILQEYGVAQGVSGIISGTGIDLYKISVFLRPVVERMSSELNRSLNYFKKQKPELEWDEFLFDGVGATFPNLVKILHENLNVNVGLLNPMRIEKYSFKNGEVISDQELPKYSINFALALNSSEKINVIPDKLRNNYRYFFPYKLAMIFMVFLIPFFIATAVISNQTTQQLREEANKKNKQWENISKDVKEYYTMIDDLYILDSYKKFLSNDRTFSINQIKILKFLSYIIPDEIKLTGLEFNEEVISEAEGSEKERQMDVNLLEVRGFIQAHASVSYIYFTNFLMSLENIPLFTKVESKLDEHSNPDGGRLIFMLKIRF